MRINCTKPFYLTINKINGYIEECNAIKYLKIAPADESKNALKYFWRKIRDLIRTKSNCLYNSKFNSSNNYDENYIKIKFNSDRNLPLKKALELSTMIKFVFDERATNTTHKCS